ncbi:MAG: aminomethyl-transferring glycine dehydrogenase [Pseudomonadota bacterium]
MGQLIGQAGTEHFSFSQLAPNDAFVVRHIGPSENDQQEMLKVLGYENLEALISNIVPTVIQMNRPLDLAGAQTEENALKALKERANRNKVFKNFIGRGYYGTYTPGVILRNILENPAWYTAYTPYQPEISQGRLEALINYQTMINDLTGLDVANASLLDEATAAAEAMGVALRTRALSSANCFFAAKECHPQTLEVLKTRAAGLGVELVIDAANNALNHDNLFGVLLQYPATDGALSDDRCLITDLKLKKITVILAADLLALTLLTPPGELGADIAVGTTQRFGVPMGFGGPHAAYMSCKDALKRHLPGRLVGVSIDSHGRPAYRLTLQTREQHIRREKATSNICTAQVLLAVIASMYAVYHGAEGLKRIANRVHRLAAVLAAGARELGINIKHDYFFDTVCLETGDDTEEVIHRSEKAEINIRRLNNSSVSISLDETTTLADIDQLWSILSNNAPRFKAADWFECANICYPESLVRESVFLTHETFRRYHSETALLRYLRELADKDLALDRTMIPLGSCTMKLNATSEMIPVTWEAFSNIHPYAPRNQVQGYIQMIAELEHWLVACTGYDAVSLQPNSGAQGEYAGLQAILAYHRSIGQSQRNIVLIPSSAHGTNPATAGMLGLEVVVVKCDSQGNVDVEDFQTKVIAHSTHLAALMITYPSTHGVFEEHIVDLCALIHQHGGQVYLDGANMNALVGVAAPGKFGADVSHLNLHKTFCIPHGGGGPGVGPIAVKEHLAGFLPKRLEWDADDHPAGAVSAAPFGSASILPISWMYIYMMGAEGLKAATQVAILNANYVAKRLSDAYPILYTGATGHIAHECIIDIRPIKDASGISGEDVAKRLMDYGFHAPTMSFPVAGTLMIEPTESESKEELDRFINAMIAIREEIRKVEKGEWTLKDNPLVNAPHTAEYLMRAQWDHIYTREEAAYPIEALRHSKYWPPVGRVDNVYGDRNVFCSCPPLLTYSPTEK